MNHHISQHKRHASEVFGGGGRYVCVSVHAYVCIRVRPLREGIPSPGKVKVSIPSVDTGGLEE